MTAAVVDLFVYGTLVPGGKWHDVVAPWVAGSRTAQVRGRLYDTGAGYPAARFDAGDRDVHGVVLRLRDPDAALAHLDAFEGPEYERVEVVTSAGETALTYQWRTDPAGTLSELQDGRWG